MILALIILAPAVLAAFIAYCLRQRLRDLSALSWIGWALIGAGAPVLIGQGAGYFLAVNGADPGDVAAVLAAGLAGGLGWGAGALSARFTGGQS